jgi:hypothetical protein
MQNIFQLFCNDKLERLLMMSFRTQSSLLHKKSKTINYKGLKIETHVSLK